MEKMNDPKTKTGAIRWLVRETLGNLILIAILFGIVGRWDWWNGWVLSAAYLLWSLGSVIFILPVNPQMLAERARPHRDAKKWDLTLVSIMGVFVLIMYVVACLDIRFGWGPQFPLAIQVAGALLTLLGYDVILLWAMTSNAFFTAIVRIQSERQHAVATGGPYRFVRHPGYSASILFYLSTPFLLGSYWALIPAILTATILIIRTHIEDQALQQELPGYIEYTGTVRFRLLPGVW